MRSSDFYFRAAGSKSMPRVVIESFLHVFSSEDFAGSDFSITFALAFSNGGIAQLVRAHDS